MKSEASQRRFLELIEQSKKLIYKVCFSYGRSESVRQDLFQEIVLQAWKSFARFDPDKIFSTWLYRIALNTAISFVRQESRKLKNESSLDENVVEIQLQTTSTVSFNDQWEPLNRAMSKLNEINKAILLLSLEEKSYAEIADIMGLSTSNVGSRLNRIKKQLKAEVQNPANSTQRKGDIHE